MSSGEHGETRGVTRGQILRWAAAVLGSALLVALYVDFIHQALRDASAFGLNPLDGFLLALPPAQVAFMVGGGMAARMSGRSQFAVKWAARTLALSLALDCLVFLYYHVAPCAVVC
ncbi:MAG TPA: hypothetical protein VFC09_04015 [Candidatus Dormibacteraeota bacterium]|nr:hypothetical protein [Candidatus Dormibacteraeota bacterium]